MMQPATRLQTLQTTDSRRDLTICGAATAGLTLLELMVVVGVIGVLTGLGLGFVGQSSGYAEARAVIGAELRLAALDARARGLPTEVEIRAGEDGELGYVRTRALTPVAVFGFEPGQRPAASDIDPHFGGVSVARGRFGFARAIQEGESGAPLHVPLPPAAVDFGDGFAIRMDLWLDKREPGQLLTFGQGLEATLDADARPRVRFVTRGSDGRAGAAFNLRSEIGLPLRRWCTLEIAANGSEFWCSLNGRDLARVSARGRILQSASDALEVLPTDEPLTAIVDEVQLFAYSFTEPSLFDQGIVVQKPVRILFDASGECYATGDISLLVSTEERTAVLRVGPGGILQ